MTVDVHAQPAEYAAPPRRSWIALLLSRAWLLLPVVLLLSPLLFRSFMIARVPDIGDPFDVEEFCRLDVPDADNAFTSYRAAAAALHPMPAAIQRKSFQIAESEGWRAAEPAIRDWVTDNHAALEVFVAGSRCDVALAIPPARFRGRMDFGAAQDVRHLARIAALDASRSEETGDYAGAWQLHNAIVRAGLHVGQGTHFERLVGNAILKQAAEGIGRWSSLPQVDANQLRQAVTDASHWPKLRVPLSRSLKFDYLHVRHELNSNLVELERNRGETKLETRLGLRFVDTSVGQILMYLAGEPQVSKHAIQILFANWLAQCDLPHDERSPLVTRSARLFSLNRKLPATVKQYSPDLVEKYLAQTTYAEQCLPYIDIAQLEQQESLPAELTVALALQLYYREHGEFPARLDLLVGNGLEQLPESFRPGTATAASYHPDSRGVKLPTVFVHVPGSSKDRPQPAVSE